MWFLFFIYMMVMARLSGSGFGQKWGVSWLPELLFCTPFGFAHSCLWYVFGFDDLWILWLSFALATAVSYAGMQSATWSFLRWESHDDPNTSRSSTLKPIVDWIAAKHTLRLFKKDLFTWGFGYKLGDEGYAWIAAGVKGFIIGLPVGGIPLAILWPLAYEIGSHSEGRVERFGIDPHTIKELLSGLSAAVSLYVFFQLLTIILHIPFYP